MSVLREPPRQTEEDLDLADIVVRLRGLTTASQKRRYRGAPPSLPSREIIVDLVDDLVAALIPSISARPTLPPRMSTPLSLGRSIRPCTHCTVRPNSN